MHSLEKGDPGLQGTYYIATIFTVVLNDKIISTLHIQHCTAYNEPRIPFYNRDFHADERVIAAADLLTTAITQFGEGSVTRHLHQS